MKLSGKGLQDPEMRLKETIRTGLRSTLCATLEIWVFMDPGPTSQVPCLHLFAGRMEVEGLSLTNPRGRCWAGQLAQETRAGSLSLALLPIPFWASLIAQLVKNPPAMQETWFDSWVGKIHWRRDRLTIPIFLGFPGGSAGKESTHNVGDLSSIPGLGRSPGEGNGNPL